MLGDAYRFGARYGWVFALAVALGVGNLIAAGWVTLFRRGRSWRTAFRAALGAAAVGVVALAYAMFGRADLVNPTADSMALAAGAMLLACLPVLRGVFESGDPDAPIGVEPSSPARRVLLREGLLAVLAVFAIGGALIVGLWFYCRAVPLGPR